MKRLTLLEAAEVALEAAESWIKDQLEGTSSYKRRMRELAPVRRAIKETKEGLRKVGHLLLIMLLATGTQANDTAYNYRYTEVVHDGAMPELNWKFALAGFATLGAALLLENKATNLQAEAAMPGNEASSGRMKAKAARLRTLSNGSACMGSGMIIIGLTMKFGGPNRRKWDQE